MSRQPSNELSRRRELHYGDRVVWCFAERMSSVYAGFQGAATKHSSSLALRFGDQEWTYAQLEGEIGRISAGFRSLEVKPGDRVAVQARNRPEFVFVFFAIQRLGAVAVPIDTRLVGAEVAHVLVDSGARVLVHDAEMSDRLPTVQERVKDLSMVVIPEPGEGKLFAEAGSVIPGVQPIASEEDIALILYTSGTTGKPKGAAITHLNIAHSILHHAGNLGLTPGDRSLIAVPLSHITGLLCGVLAPLCTGGTLILLPYFKAKEFLKAAAASRMTYAIMVPAMYNLCLRVEDFDSYDLSSWRLGHFGGSPMPQATIDTLARKLPRLQLVNGYGATEVCSPAAMWPVGDSSIPITSVGRAVPCAEIVVVDPDSGIEVPIGDSGELWIRGPMVIKEYWNNREATEKGIVGGFWRSGDIGNVDAHGNVYVHDRLKDLINRGGYKIYSAEVEGLLLEFEGLVEAAVVAKPDPVLGERVHAFVTVARAISEAELAAFCSAKLGDYKVPESWSIGRDPLPRTTTSKVDKKVLRARLLS